MQSIFEFCKGALKSQLASSIINHHTSFAAFLALHPHSPQPTMDIITADLPPVDLPPVEKEKNTRKRRSSSIAVEVEKGNKNKKQIPKTPKQCVETSPGAPGPVVPLASTSTPSIRVARSRKPPDDIQPKYTETPSPKKPEKQLTNRDYESRRIAIGYIYMHTLGAPKPSEWDGKDGTIGDICKRLDLSYSQRKSVKECLTRMITCRNMGIEYDGKKKDMGESSRVLLIQAGSVEMQIIADSVDMGFSIRKTTELVNEHRKQNDDKEVGLSTVFEVYKKLKPVMTTEEQQELGSNDPESTA
jgi:hypothetical protein